MRRNWYFLLPAVFTSIFWIYAFYLEFFNYPNYVFARFHLDPYRTAVIPGLITAIYVFFRTRAAGLKTPVVILLLLFCLVSIPSGLSAMGNVLARTALAARGPGYITAKAMDTAYGSDYKFLDFVQSYIKNPPGVKVAIPPMSLPWRHTGDTYMAASFLYPAVVTHMATGSAFIMISSEADGAGYRLWPDFSLPAKKIIIYDWVSGRGVEYPGRNWNPGEWQARHPWGLIIPRT